MPCPLLLTRLAALYGYPHTEGVDRLRDGARRTLAVLALAQDPAGASTGELLAELEGLEYLLSVIGQLRGCVQDAQHRLVDELAGRLPETAHVPAEQRPPGSDAHRALHAYARGGYDGPGTALLARGEQCRRALARPAR
jgi:hypothetical protein